jgi:hypothetical protein
MVVLYQLNVKGGRKWLKKDYLNGKEKINPS